MTAKSPPLGIYRGEVTRFDFGQPFIKIARLTGDYEYGPLAVLEGPWSIGATAQANGPDLHAHDVSSTLVAGDKVLVAFLEGVPDDPVILGRLT